MKEPPPLHRGSETILLIEDEGVIRLLFSSRLIEAGYTVLEADDGEEGLALCQGHTDQIDLIVTDLSLPGLSGDFLLSQLHTLAPGAKMIVCTAYPVYEPEWEGVQIILNKPVLPERMLQAVRTVLDQANSDPSGINR